MLLFAVESLEVAACVGWWTKLPENTHENDKKVTSHNYTQENWFIPGSLRNDEQMLSVWIIEAILFIHSCLCVTEWGAICNNQKHNFPTARQRSSTDYMHYMSEATNFDKGRALSSSEFGGVFREESDVTNGLIIQGFLSKMRVLEMFIQRRSSPSRGESCRKKNNSILIYQSAYSAPYTHREPRCC